MDITPQVINEVEFPLKVRGYDPDEVDDFLERVAVGVGQLQERLQQTTERAAIAERRAVELEQAARDLERQVSQRPAAAAGAAGSTPTSPGSVDETEELTRTLAMAQRFVDQAMREAKEDADKAVAEARDNAERLRAEADAELLRARTASQARIAEEVVELERARDSLQGDVDALAAHVEAHRERLRSALAEFGRLLDQPETLRAGESPELSGASLPSFARDVLPDEDAVDEVVAASVDADAPIDEPSGAADDNVEGAPPAEPQAPSAAAEENDADHDQGWARFAQGPEPVGSGPPTAAYAGPGDEADDPYLAELRRAIGGEADAGPGDNGLFDQEDDPAYRPRFRRRG